MNHYINYQMNQNILLNKSEGEGNACIFSICIKIKQSILKIIYIILYIFEIHDKIFNVYNQ